MVTSNSNQVRSAKARHLYSPFLAPKLNNSTYSDCLYAAHESNSSHWDVSTSDDLYVCADFAPCDVNVGGGDNIPNLILRLQCQFEPIAARWLPTEIADLILGSYFQYPWAWCSFMRYAYEQICIFGSTIFYGTSVCVDLLA